MKKNRKESEVDPKKVELAFQNKTNKEELKDQEIKKTHNIINKNGMKGLKGKCNTDNDVTKRKINPLTINNVCHKGICANAAANKKVMFICKCKK